jgi:glyceraldehyde 3-phosphate dehydrogenase
MKKTRIAINGFGRIGRIFFRQAFDQEEFEFAAINDLGDLQNLAYLLKYDTVYRSYPGEIKTVTQDGQNYLVVDGDHILVTQEKDPTKLPWKALKVDIVVECTGIFESFEKASVHLQAGARRVVISAPAKDDEGLDRKTILLGVNDNQFSTTTITSNGSCTTNATSPVVAVMMENPGIVKAALSTVHGYTATQSLTDSPAKGNDYRRGRAAAQNIVPSSTGAAVSVARAFPDLKGKFDGVALRVPVVAGSLVDLTFLAKRKTTVEEINSILKQAAASPRWNKIMKVTEDQVVSSDIIGEPYGAVIDLRVTQVIDGDLVKIFSWYDNEWGYVSTLVQHILKAGESLS